jgi:hypothetical protein
VYRREIQSGVHAYTSGHGMRIVDGLGTGPSLDGAAPAPPESLKPRDVNRICLWPNDNLVRHRFSTTEWIPRVPQTCMRPVEVGWRLLSLIGDNSFSRTFSRNCQLTALANAASQWQAVLWLSVW